ncbi:DUF4402 domain-containing protein [Sphingomicrobium clamense]|uniref:DUF4402 domain-containing protein n=1 Tax=Sphingomicrobium clamense TaxID=2851013 RepID=A0ABS6V311_9SPHN|nr:DUF4402 domain-containing protein [Sphingomicrobium sp. B8]MBW0143919.1 DUF4402 domain-containing protein [Sphingomicrobium sp. B8]
MKTLTKLAAIVAATAVATPAFAAPVSDSNGSARVNIVRGLSLTSTGDIDFGTIVLPGSGTGAVSSTIAIDSAGDVTATCGTGFTCSLATGDTSTFESYDLTGTRNVNVNITIPNEALIYVDGNTANPSLTVTLDPSLTGGVSGASSTVYTETLPNSGAAGSAAAFNFTIGGSITVPDNQADGAYTGTFQVSADYE